MDNFVKKIIELKRGIVVVNDNLLLCYDHKKIKTGALGKLTFSEFLISLAELNKESKVSRVLKKNKTAVIIIGGLTHSVEEYESLSKMFTIAHIPAQKDTISSLIGIESPIMENSTNLISDVIRNIRKEIPLASFIKKKSVQHLKIKMSVPMIALAALIIVTIILPTMNEIPYELLLQASALEAKGDYTSSYEIYEMVLDKHPDNITALSGKGNSLLGLGNYDEALNIFDEIVILDSQNKAAMIGKYYTLTSSEKYDEALDHLNNLPTDLNPIVLRENSRITELNKWQNILKGDPQNTEALTGIGNIYDKMGLYTKANEYYDKALEIEPAHANANNGKGNVALHLRQLEEAKNFYKYTLDLHPHNVNAKVGQGSVLITEQKYSMAIDLFYEVYQRDPSNKNTLQGWGDALVEIGRYDEATEKFHDLLIHDNDNVFALLGIAKIYAKQNDYETAINNLDQILDNDPWNVDILMAKGDMLFDNGKIADAKKEYEKILEIEPTNQKALNGITSVETGS